MEVKIQRDSQDDVTVVLLQPKQYMVISNSDEKLKTPFEEVVPKSIKVNCLNL